MTKSGNVFLLQWHLICERAWLKTFFQNAYTVGLIFGCLVGGDVGDRSGQFKWFSRGQTKQLKKNHTGQRG